MTSTVIILLSITWLLGCLAASYVYSIRKLSKIAEADL